MTRTRRTPPTLPIFPLDSERLAAYHRANASERAEVVAAVGRTGRADLQTRRRAARLAASRANAGRPVSEAVRAVLNPPTAAPVRAAAEPTSHELPARLPDVDALLRRLLDCDPTLAALRAVGESHARDVHERGDSTGCSERR